MFAVLSMHPDLPPGQWLLLTLTLGVGGSAAGNWSPRPESLALGQDQGKGYTRSHSTCVGCPLFYWGYFASIAVHFWINARYF